MENSSPRSWVCFLTSGGYAPRSGSEMVIPKNLTDETVRQALPAIHCTGVLLAFHNCLATLPRLPASTTAWYLARRVSQPVQSRIRTKVPIGANDLSLGDRGNATPGGPQRRSRAGRCHGADSGGHWPPMGPQHSHPLNHPAKAHNIPPSTTASAGFSRIRVGDSHVLGGRDCLVGPALC